MRRILRFMWRVIKWIVGALFGGLSAGALSILSMIYGLIFWPLQLTLFAGMVASLVKYVPVATLSAYGSLSWLLEYLGLGSLSRHWIIGEGSRLHTGANVLLGADGVARLELVSLLPWTLSGWIMLAAVFGIAYTIMNLPYTISARMAKRRQLNLENEVANLRDQVKRWGPRDGEILQPVRTVPQTTRTVKFPKSARPQVGFEKR